MVSEYEPWRMHCWKLREHYKPLQLTFLARLFFGENRRYFDSLGVIVVVQELWHFVISLLLLKILTWNLESLFTIQRAIHPIKGTIQNAFSTELCPFFYLKFLSSILLSSVSSKVSTCMRCSCLKHCSMFWQVYFSWLFVTLSQTSPAFYVFSVQVFWKHCGERRNCS